MKNFTLATDPSNISKNFQPLKISARLFLILILSAGFAANAAAQDNILKDSVPPPLFILSQGENERLSSEPDMKKRTQLALELMETRLKKAETFSNEKKYKECLDELGSFQAIMRDALKYLQRNDTGNKKVLNNFKRLEINLRSFVPRLELVRRLMPQKFGYHVIQLMKSVRKTRSNAVEPLFDDALVSDN